MDDRSVTNPKRSEPLDFGKARVEAFSDGVIAIIVTIMVLELRPPHSAEASALLKLWPIFVSYILSYVFVAIYWVNHHNMLKTARHVGTAVLWSNVLLLFCLSLIPFATAFMGENHFETFPVFLYALVQFACALSYLVLATAIASQHKDDPAFMAQHRAATPKNLASVTLYALAVPLSLVNTTLAFVIFAGIGLTYALPTLFWRPQRPPL